MHSFGLKDRVYLYIVLFLEIWICDYWKLEDKYTLFYLFVS